MPSIPFTLNHNSRNDTLSILQSISTAPLENKNTNTPEPSTWGAMGMTLSMLCMLSNRRRRAAAHAHHFTS